MRKSSVKTCKYKNEVLCLHQNRTIPAKTTKSDRILYNRLALFSSTDDLRVSLQQQLGSIRI